MKQSENRDLRTGMKIGIHGPIRNIDLWTTQKYRDQWTGKNIGISGPLTTLGSMDRSEIYGEDQESAGRGLLGLGR